MAVLTLVFALSMTIAQPTLSASHAVLGPPTSIRPALPKSMNTAPVADLLEHGRIVWLGDSFGIGSIPARVPMAMLLLDGEPIPVTAVCTGPLGGFSTLVRASFLEPATEYATPHPWNLPVRWVNETDTPANLSPIVEYRPINGFIGDYGGNRWLDPADLVTVRPLVFDPHMSALPDQDLGTGRVATVWGDSALVHGGAVAFKTDGQGAPLSGVYWSVLAESSWSHWDYAGNIAGPGFKSVDREDMQAYMQSTTIDDRPVGFIVHLANELHTEAGHEAYLRAYIEETAAWCEGIDDDPFVLFVISYNHYTQGLTTIEECRDNAYAMTRAAQRVCRDYPEQAAYYSYIVAMDGLRPTPSDPGFTAWATAHGFDAFDPWGLGAFDNATNWLDAGELHPTIEGAAALAWMLREAIR